MSNPNQTVKENTKKKVFILISVVLVCFVSLIACEVMMILYFWMQDGELLSIEEKLAREKNTFVQEFTDSEKGCSFVDILLPHPYVSFVVFNNPCRKKNFINQAGFFGPEFPLHKPKDKFVILFTGGSVAAQLAGLHGTPLQDLLVNRFGKIEDKEIVLLNGAQGAWKQPQQTILFMLYAEVIDAVITLDGFNESNQLRTRHARLEIPSRNFHQVNPQLTSDYRELVKAWLSRKFYDYSRNSWWISHSRLAYFLTLKTRQTFYDELESENKAVGESSEKSLSDIRKNSAETMFYFPPGTSHEQAFQKNLELYQKYTRSIHTLSRQMGIKNAHFIQPAPAIGKTLTPEEKGRVGDLAYGPVYQKMADGLLELNKEGVPVVSLLQIFKDIKEPLYKDPIHCDNKIKDGKRPCYDMMANAIADFIQKEWNLQPASR